MEPFDYLRILVARWRIVVATVLLAIGVAWFTTPAATAVEQETADSYTATATLVRAAGSEQSTARVAVFVTTGMVPVAAAQALGYDDEPAVLAQRVTVESDDNVGTLTISVSDPKRAEAARIANEFVDQLGLLMTRLAARAPAESAQVRLLRPQLVEAERLLGNLGRRVDDESSELLQTRLLAAENNLRVLLEQHNLAVTAARAEAAPLQVVQRAVAVPDSSTGFAAPTSRYARAGLAGAGGLALGCALALVVARIDTRLRRRSEVQAAYGLPVLAEVPSVPWWRRHDDHRSFDLDPRGPVGDSFRGLRSALLLTDPVVLGAHGDPGHPGNTVAAGADPHRPTTLIVVSAGSGEGRTMVTVNLAASMAETGKRVVVVDCDLRNPKAHKLLGVPAGLGVTDVGDPDRVVEPASLVRATMVPGVSLIQAGTCDRRMKPLPVTLPGVIAAAREVADVVLLDCPPMLAGTEAMDAMANADGALVVCRAGRTSRDQAERVQELLARVRVPAYGVALFGSRRVRSSSTSGRGWRLRRSGPVAPRRAPSDPDPDRSRELATPLARSVTPAGTGSEPADRAGSPARSAPSLSSASKHERHQRALAARRPGGYVPTQSDRDDP